MESRLRQGEKLEAIGTLAGGIAHDFNNILGSILAVAEQARPDAAGTALSASLDHIVAACGRAKDIVRQMLAFSHQTTPERRTMALRGLIEETMPLLRAALPATIDIRCDAAAPGSVTVNPAEVHQVLMNLSLNAYHAMADRPSGRLTIVLNRVVADEPLCASHPRLSYGTAYLCLAVSDTGRGIPPEHLERIFDPFFTTKAPGEGTGLGLASVHGIVTSLSGEISVYTEVGHGTTFRIYLPEVQSLEAVPLRPEPDPAPGHGCVLLVDDEPLLLDVTTLFLAKLGYEVVPARDGESGWQLFEADPGAFDILMTDLTMPGLSGADLIRRVRARRPELPVVLSSGFGDSLRAGELASLSLGAYLQKPYTQRELAAALLTALGS
jgi:two-component system, cell cycle sensor histidine kinase and response regulator CckA